MKLSGLRVLLAEDNPTNQLVATQMLETLGATVTLAQDGAEALEIFGEHEFDAMLVDIEMPRVSGLEMIRRVRADSSPRSQIPMIALTAYVMRDHRAAIDAAGADGVIAKPILSIEQLGQDVLRFMCKRVSSGESAIEGRVDAVYSDTLAIDEAVYQSLVQAIGPVAMADLLGKVVADIRSAAARLAEALERGDLAGIRSASHILASVSGAIGATRVQEGAKHLSVIAHRGDMAALRELSPTLMLEIERALAAVESRQ